MAIKLLCSWSSEKVSASELLKYKCESFPFATTSTFRQFATCFENYDHLFSVAQILVHNEKCNNVIKISVLKHFPSDRELAFQRAWFMSAEILNIK